MLVDAFLNDKLIDDRIDDVVLVFIEFDLVAQIAFLAIDPRVPVSVHTNLFEQIFVVFAENFRDRCSHFDFGSFRQSQHVFHHLVRRLAVEFLLAPRAVRNADGGKQHSHVVPDVGHRADGRTRVAADGFLIDRNDRREPVHKVDIRLALLPDKPLRIGRHRSQQPALPFRVDRVERQRRLAGTTNASDNDQLIARQFDGDILQVVLASTLDFDCFSHWCESVSRRP